MICHGPRLNAHFCVFVLVSVFAVPGCVSERAANRKDPTVVIVLNGDTQTSPQWNNTPREMELI